MIDERPVPFQSAVAAHDERNAKGSGNYYRISGGAGDSVVLGKSSPAASVTFLRGEAKRLTDCHCIAPQVSIFAHEFRRACFSRKNAGAVAPRFVPPLHHRVGRL